MRRLARLSAIAALAFAAYLLIAGAFFSVVIDRTLTVGPLARAFAPDPKVSDPFALNYAGDPKKAFGYRFETVGIATALGNAPAWWVPIERPANPQVAALYVHGIAGRRENGYRQLAALRDAGIPLLMISYRNDAGAPRAPGGFYTFGLDEWRDVDAAITWLRSRGYTRILLAGESMGGGIVGQTIVHSPQRTAVTALLLDSPALDFRHVIRGLVASRNLPASDAVAAAAIALFRLRRQIDMAGANVVGTIAAFPGPVFVAHGTADPIVPVAITDGMIAERQGVTTYLRTRASHLASWHENPDRYRRQMAHFAAPLTE